MAGSKKYFKYADDTGEEFSVQLDESNSEAECNNVALFLDRTANHPGLPKGLKMRYCLAYCDNNPKLRRRFWIGNGAAVDEVIAGNTLSANAYPTSADSTPVSEDFIITYYSGERRSIPPSFSGGADTGLEDGDTQP
jgi:hypothetical protein